MCVTALSMCVLHRRGRSVDVTQMCADEMMDEIMYMHAHLTPSQRILYLIRTPDANL